MQTAFRSPRKLQCWPALVLLLSACAGVSGQLGAPSPSPSPQPKVPSGAGTAETFIGKAATAPQADTSKSPLTAQSSPAELPASAEPLATAKQAGLQAATGERGLASLYSPYFQGKRTASGERFDTHTLTAAHKTLPFGTRVRVLSLSTGKEVVVRINDRGPFVKGRIIDLSNTAAKALGFNGLHQVEIARLP